MKTQKYRITLTLTEDLLGTVPKSKEIYADYIASRAEDVAPDVLDDELETVPDADDLEERGWTGFHVHPDGGPALYDYVIRGFFKEACYTLRQVADTASKSLTAYKKKIDGMVFVEPRLIPFVLPDGAGMGVLERPLRAQTAKGERVALARSDTCPPGTTLTFTLEILGNQITRAHIEEWLWYGSRKGLGQWRSGSYGRFTYELEEVE